jgi:hypothetical protein
MVILIEIFITIRMMVIAILIIMPILLLVIKTFASPPPARAHRIGISHA